MNLDPPKKTMGRSKILTLPTPIARKQAGQLWKLFGFWGNKTKDPIKRLQQRADVLKDGVPRFLSQTQGLRGTYVTRRQITLNRHFTEIVSDVLAQSFKDQLDSFGVSITSIETRGWNLGVRIYYTMEKFDEYIHDQLNKMVPDVMSAITERRLIGRTPGVAFVYDQSIAMDQLLNEAMSKITIDAKEESQLVTVGATQLHVSKDLGNYEQKLVSKRFVAPIDMDNTLLGIDYPVLYDEVAMKMSRSRSEVSRMKMNLNVLADAKPLFRAARDDVIEDDPLKRILRMKKFIISQKQKSENFARSRRKAEIYARNSVKWQIVDENDQLLDKDEVTA